MISDLTIRRLVEKANWIVGSHFVTEELLDRITDWLANSDVTIEELVKVLNEFQESVRTWQAVKAAKRCVRREQVVKAESVSPTQARCPPCVANSF